jgi:hypothetical protein
MARAQRTPSTKQPAGVSAAPPISPVRGPNPTDVAARAYQLWQQSGCAHGRDQEFWFQAERELRARPALH